MTKFLKLVIFLITCAIIFSLPAFSSGIENIKDTLSLVAVGDVLLDRGVAEKLESRKAEDVLVEVIPILKKSDITFCNLECPIVSNPFPLPKPISFAASPLLAKFLKHAGFDIVSLANNHTMDCGKSGLLETMSHLKKLDIAFCGAGKNEREALSPTILTINGLRVAFLAYSDFSPEGIIRLPESPTIAVLDEDVLYDEIRKAKKKADIIVVSFHWGREFYPLPTARQRRIAEKSIATGADLILGHHPHVLQPVEIKVNESGRKAVIAYSLGNFIFDSTKEGSDESIMVECQLSQKGVENVKTYKVKIQQEPLKLIRIK